MAWCSTRAARSQAPEELPLIPEVFSTYGADAPAGTWCPRLMSGGDLAMPKDGSDIGKSMSQVIIRA
jgi:hypothetical protein